MRQPAAAMSVAEDACAVANVKWKWRDTSEGFAYYNTYATNPRPVPALPFFILFSGQ